jgi:chloride channel protein, CIC family
VTAKDDAVPSPALGPGAFRLLRNEQFVLYVLALLAGAVAAYGAIGFRWLIGFVQGVGFGNSGDNLATPASALPWWQILAVPTAGGLAVGLFIYYVLPGRRPQGVADVIEAAAFKGGRMALRDGLAAALASGVSLGAGASVGREGPVVHLGATIGSWVAGRLRLSRSRTLTLLGCGVGAAVAASFNAPIAGVFFAHEVVLGHYAASAFAPIVIASVVGTAITRLHFGDFPAFIVPHFGTMHDWEFGLFGVIGVASGGIALLLLLATQQTQRAAALVPGPAWLRPAVGGLLVGGIALFNPHVLGVGYEAADQALKSQLPLAILATVLGAKLLATAVSHGFGLAGGVFSPALVIGAMLGGTVGALAGELWPGSTAQIGDYAMVGMGGTAAAVLGAPISTTLIMFELTNDYRMTIAVMVAAAVATVIVRQTRYASFFTWQLERIGVRLAGGRERGLLRAERVDKLMSTDYAATGPDTKGPELIRLLAKAPGGMLFVVDAERRLLGTIAVGGGNDALFDAARAEPVSAAELMHRSPVLEAAQDLEMALATFEQAQESPLAVVDSRERMSMVGVIHERHVRLAYERSLLQARREEHGEA